MPVRVHCRLWIHAAGGIRMEEIGQALRIFNNRPNLSSKFIRLTREEIL